VVHAPAAVLMVVFVLLVILIISFFLVSATLLAQADIKTIIMLTAVKQLKVLTRYTFLLLSVLPF